MKLLDTSEVCNLLGISRSTLYRWCNMTEEHSFLDTKQATKSNPLLKSLVGNNQLGYSSEDESITDFPRPFKIGRSLKWRDDEIMQWLESKRI